MASLTPQSYSLYNYRRARDVFWRILLVSPASGRRRLGALMINEKINVRVTETRQFMEVVVLSKRADRIEVVLGEGAHSVKCALTPTRTGQAYVGRVMGREIVYEHSREQVQGDIDKLNPAMRKSGRH